MSFIPIMEVTKNGTEAIEKKEGERAQVDEEDEQEEEIEGTRSMIAKEGHQSLMAFFFRIAQIAVMVFGQEHATSMSALRSSGFSRTRSTMTYPRTSLAGSSTS